MWNSLERLVKVCEEEQVDLLLIAGDLFHRQPLLRELKEVDYLFSQLTHTKIVFIAGNHDYLKPSSYYLTYQWKSQVYPLLEQTMGFVEFEELGTSVYGFSYGQKEIREEWRKNHRKVQSKEEYNASMQALLAMALA